VGLLVSLALGFSACSDKSHRMSELEAANYKRELVKTHPGEISLEQASQLMYHPARTRGEIDEAFDKFRTQHAKEAAAERAQFESGRRTSGKKSATSPTQPAP
jgi:hypothetical protein